MQQTTYFPQSLKYLLPGTLHKKLAVICSRYKKLPKANAPMAKRLQYSQNNLLEF